MTANTAGPEDKERSNGKLFLIVAVLAALTAVALVGGRQLKNVLMMNKMAADVALLNNAVRSFQSGGGKFSENETIESVISALKNFVPDQEMAGFSSFNIDKQFAWKMQTPEEAATEKPRTVWNQTTFRFEIVTSGGPGVSGFRLETAEEPKGESLSALADHEKSGDSREIDSSNWIPVSLSSVESELSFSRDLKSPVFSIPSGLYPLRDFDLKVDIENPNPEGISSMIYSIDYGPWKPFEGESVAVGAGETLLAIAKSMDTNVANDSPSATAKYVATGEPATKNAVLSFGDKNVKFEGAGNHYYSGIGGSKAKMGLLVSDSQFIQLAKKADDIASNGDSCAFWVSNSSGSESSTITMDFSENPVLALGFMLYHVDVLQGGDKITVKAATDQGTVLAKPAFTFIANAEDGVSYDPALGEADVNVGFVPPEGEAITRVTLKWEGSDPSESSERSIGLGEISFEFR